MRKLLYPALVLLMSASVVPAASAAEDCRDGGIWPGRGCLTPLRSVELEQAVGTGGVFDDVIASDVAPSIQTAVVLWDEVARPRAPGKPRGVEQVTRTPMGLSVRIER